MLILTGNSRSHPCSLTSPQTSKSLGTAHTPVGYSALPKLFILNKTLPGRIHLWIPGCTNVSLQVLTCSRESGLFDTEPTRNSTEKHVSQRRSCHAYRFPDPVDNDALSGTVVEFAPLSEGPCRLERHPTGSPIVIAIGSGILVCLREFD